MAKFSIITIAYNSERTIERTIQSVLGQSLLDYEYIIIDGTSKDHTLDIVKAYEPQFEGKMRWISEPDGGIYDAMNKGIRLSSGEIVGIVNSDDWLDPSALEKVYTAYCNNGCSCDSIYTGGMAFHSNDGSVRILMPNGNSLRRYAKIGDIAGVRHPATFVPRKIYNEHGMYDTRMKVSADADFLLRFYYGGGQYFLINDILTNMSDGGASNTVSLSYINDRMLPDRRLLMKNLGFTLFRQKFNIGIWQAKMYLKVFLNYLGIFRVR